MEAPIHSSFIPTQDALPHTQEVEYGKSAADIFVLLGLISLIISGAVSAGVFLYDQYAQNELATQKEQLKLGQKSFSADALDQLMRLDERLRLGESILGGHTAPSVLFAILQETTLQSVQFISLDYQQASPSEIKVSMKGRAQSVNAIALQANIFSRHAAIKDPIFQINDFTKDGVTFTVTMMLNADLLRFQSLVAASQRAVSQPARTQTLQDTQSAPDVPDAQNQQGGESPQSFQPATQTPAKPQAPSTQQPAAEVPSGFGSFNE